MVSRITSIILVVLILIGVPLFIMALGAEEEPGKADPILYGIYVYFALAAIVTLFGSITGILANPKRSEKHCYWAGWYAYSNWTCMDIVNRF